MKGSWVLLVLVLVVVSSSALGSSMGFERYHKHPDKNSVGGPEIKADPGGGDEKDGGYWKKLGAEALKARLAEDNRKGTAKNVIFFLGDGMSVPTIAATRMYMGGENVDLSFDLFPNTAISKTYCVDYQVADSACTATAYLGGVKANLGTLGITASIPYGDCGAIVDESQYVNTLARQFQDKGRSAGVVTTTRVTHATPGGLYAHSAAREYEADTDVIEYGNDPDLCTDIATQLVEWDTGKNLKVIMGGGTGAFLPFGTKDDEGNEGYRSDGVNLIDRWQQIKKDGELKAQYVWNREQLLSINPETDYVLGLFDPSHCQYNLDRDKDLDPSLEDMTEAAIKVLSKDSKGYFLLVEGGRIDTGHHDATAHKALDETAEFSKAIQKAVDMTNGNDTLIIVTADHAHTMSYSGYPLRGSNILGLAGDLADDQLPFTTINYANGPGFRPSEEGGKRHDPSNDNLDDKDYAYASVAPLESETHGGDDVIIYAKGPWSHLFRGVMEQSAIPHIIAYASCVGDSPTACDDTGDSGTNLVHSPLIIMLAVIVAAFANFAF